MRPQFAWLAVAILAVAGCTAGGVINARAPSEGTSTTYRFDPLLQDREADRLFVCLTLSGGGIRAAAFAFGVMDELQRIPSPRVGSTLLQDVDCISAVSGGAFAAAHYGLFGDGFFRDFPRRFLYRNITLRLLLAALNPLGAARLLSPTFNRSGLAAEVYDAALFQGATYQALIERRRRPFIILNSTNLVNGERFEFTQDQFDVLGSDLGPLPLSYAVAASAALPVLLAPVRLDNHAPAGGMLWTSSSPW